MFGFEDVSMGSACGVDSGDSTVLVSVQLVRVQCPCVVRVDQSLRFHRDPVEKTIRNHQKRRKVCEGSVAHGARLVASHAAAAVVSVTFGCGAFYSLRKHPAETSYHWKSCFTFAE